MPDYSKYNPPYPNQPDNVSDKAFRIATNISVWLSRHNDIHLSLGQQIKIAEALDGEYGKFNEVYDEETGQYKTKKDANGLINWLSNV